MAQLHKESSGQEWEVAIHLLYSPASRNHSFPSKAKDVESFQSERLRFAVKFYAVDDLFVEDWNEAIGVEIKWSGETFLVKPASEGKLLVRSTSGEIKVYESNELNNFIDSLISASVSEAMLTDPTLVLKTPN